ncbi:hypothetical protein BKA67DRAFT_663833 [Truncatella angustata]|uniref:Uncharacterized protein n=1 Tax=Truncatella angustata TaxID=152316 RepID=A0A9P8RHL0_9PEZI|nr:uncharacterized protein BKA67DRAFT_663833 [Truncatella angustata]KAH6645959.1 hypothetical protein BKA67DRAFT_663833 [Truncatella angustata]
MAGHPVFRFPIVDDATGAEKGSFLLQVIPTQGSKNPLDLRLVGTQSTSAYQAKLRHRRVQEWKNKQSNDKSARCTDEEWEQILIATFIEPTNPHRRDIEVIVEIQASAILIIRRNTLCVKHRLGHIELEEFEITENKDGSDNGPQLFDWCVAAISDRAKVVDDLAAARARTVELEKSTKELRAHLEDLLKAKEHDEHQLLQKFQQLLNEKKLKIRQQQRLLVSADVDPQKLKNVGASQNTVSKAKTSRGGKRKATQQAVEDESDDGFEKMDVDLPVDVKAESESDPEMDQRQTTDEELEDTTASEAAETDEGPQPATKAKGKGKANARGKARAKGKAPAAGKKMRAANTKTAAPPVEAEDETDDEPPPPRTLPFQSRNKPKENMPEPFNSDGGDETETDDDEL